MGCSAEEGFRQIERAVVTGAAILGARDGGQVPSTLRAQLSKTNVPPLERYET
jgi:hypothetical protein